MAELTFVARGVGLAGSVVSFAPLWPCALVRKFALASGPGRDWRMVGDTGGTLLETNRVMVNPSSTAPEVPFAGARVRLHRLTDGYCAWEGISDAAGYYWPRGLEVGLEYYPVAIDLTRTHECDAAGPVMAVKAP